MKSASRISRGNSAKAATARTRAVAANSVVGLDHVVLRVRDLAASVAFYKHVLGAKVERQLRIPRIVQLRIGACLLDLVPGRAARAGSENMDHFALRVLRFDPVALARRLARFGIEPGAVVERYGAKGYGPSIYFHDLDANMIEFKGPARRASLRRADQ